MPRQPEIVGGGKKVDQPWNSAWGKMARTIGGSQANADTTEHEITSLATAFTAVAGRLYRISVVANVRDEVAGAHNVHFTLRIKNNTTLIETATVWNCVNSAGNDDRSFSKNVELSGVSGTITIRITYQYDNAAGYTGIAPSTVCVDDIGPA